MDSTEQLYKTYVRELLMYAYSLLRNAAMAEDIVQETFVKAILSLPAGHANKRAWLYRVCKNLCLNQIRRKTNLEKPLEEDMVITEDFLPDILRKEEEKCLYQCILLLRPAQKEALILQYYGGLSQKEIAAIMGITNGAVRTLCYRAKIRLKELMEVKENEL